jgi:hypothetical protein
LTTLLKLEDPGRKLTSSLEIEARTKYIVKLILNLQDHTLYSQYLRNYNDDMDVDMEDNIQV